MKFVKQDTAQDIKGIQDTMRQGWTRFKRSNTRKIDKRNSRYESMNHESNQAIHDNTRYIKDSHDTMRHDTQDIKEPTLKTNKNTPLHRRAEHGGAVERNKAADLARFEQQT